MVSGWVAGLTENKTEPSSWGLAELGNKQNQIVTFFITLASTKNFETQSISEYKWKNIIFFVGCILFQFIFYYKVQIMSK